MNAKQIQFVDKRDGLTWTVTICIYLLVANGRFTTLARSQSGSAVIVQNNWDVAQKNGMDWDADSPHEATIMGPFSNWGLHG